MLPLNQEGKTMNTVTFDLPAKIKVRDKITGLAGIITVRIQPSITSSRPSRMVKPRSRRGGISIPLI
jgi:hypothetical protein